MRGMAIYYGANAHVQDADQTFVRRRSCSIDADALQSGDGSKAAVWATGSTDFLGKHQLRGGAKGGDGGGDRSVRPCDSRDDQGSDRHPLPRRKSKAPC